MIICLPFLASRITRSSQARLSMHCSPFKLDYNVEEVDLKSNKDELILNLRCGLFIVWKQRNSKITHWSKTRPKQKRKPLDGWASSNNKKSLWPRSSCCLSSKSQYKSCFESYSESYWQFWPEKSSEARDYFISKKVSRGETLQATKVLPIIESI